MRNAGIKWLLCACAVLGLTSQARAKDPDPAVVAHLAVGSLNSLQTVSDEIEIPLPGFMTAAGLEQQFDFLGQGGMKTDLPLSVDIIAGDSLAQQQEAIIYLPVTEGHAPISTFLANGKPLGTDGAIVNGMPFRRTGSYLFFGGTPDLVQGFKLDQLPDADKDTPLMKVSFDAKLFREIAPGKLADFRKSQLDEIDPNAAKSEQAGQRFAVDAMTNGLDFVSVRLERVDELLRLTTQIQPCPVLNVHPCMKPGLPSDCAFRMDWQPPHDWAGRGLKAVIGMVGEEAFYKEAELKLEDRKPTIQLMARAGETLFGGDEATYAMESLDDGPVLYSVTKSSTPRDLGKDLAELKSLWDSISGSNTNGTMAISTHNLPNGTPVQRILITGEKGDLIYVDVVQVGDQRMVAITTKPNDAVSRLMNLSDDGPLNEPASGWFDGKNTLDLFVSGDSKSIANLKDEDRELLNKVLKNQRISWKLTTDHDKLSVVLDVPVVLVKNVTKNFAGLQDVITKLSAK